MNNYLEISYTGLCKWKGTRGKTFISYVLSLRWNGSCSADEESICWLLRSIHFKIPAEISVYTTSLNMKCETESAVCCETSNSKAWVHRSAVRSVTAVHFIKHTAPNLDTFHWYSLACRATTRLTASEVGNRRNTQYKSLFIEAISQRYSIHGLMARPCETATSHKPALRQTERLLH